MALPAPSPLVGIKLASLAVHAQEMVQSDHPFDVMDINLILDDPEVKAYLDTLRPMGLLPVPR